MEESNFGKETDNFTQQYVVSESFVSHSRPQSTYKWRLSYKVRERGGGDEREKMHIESSGQSSPAARPAPTKATTTTTTTSPGTLFSLRNGERERERSLSVSS